MIIFDELKSYVDRYKQSYLSFQKCKNIKLLSFKTTMLIMLVFLLGVGSWELGFGHWPLAISCWHWGLGIGSWHNECLEIPLYAIAYRGMVRANQDKKAAAQEFGFRERPSAAAWSASAMCTIPPATTGAAESPHFPTGTEA